jgi:iron complex outermembrane receptor protein
MTHSRPCAALFAILSVGLVTTAQAQDAVAPTPEVKPTTLSPVVVRGQRGTAADDYRVNSVDSLGPLGSTKILDAPYSIGVLPLELIENSQAKNFKEVSKYLPLVSFQEQQGPQILRPQTRGMQGGNFQNSRLDGMTMYVTVANAMEQFQQIEVLNGVSASLYGPANPSGMFNFVSKRPTDTPLRRVTLSYDTSSIATAHADLSGRLDDNGVLRYRVNALAADGEGYVDGSKLKRNLGSLAFDVRPEKDTVIELNYSDYRLVQKGYPGWFTYGQAIVLPSAPDPTRVGYGQEYAGVDMQTKTGSARIKHDFSTNWHLVAGVLNQDARRDINTPVNNLRSNAGNYVSSLANGFAPRFMITSDMAYLNGTFDALGVAHDLSIGTAGYKSRSYAVTKAATAASVLLGSASIDDPQVFAMPAAGLPNTADSFVSSIVYQQGVNIGDTITFSDAWSARLAVSQDSFHVVNFNATGASLPGYADNGLSPTASLIFKPRPNMSTYLTYASSLQAGDVAPGTAANSGLGLAPYRSKQVEAGVKVSLARVDLTAAVFRIERPFANIDPTDNVFKISGKQVNTGLEFTAVGEVVDRLTAYGGLTLLNAKLNDTGNAATDGKRFVGNPKVKGNVLLEYRIPGFDGLVGSADWQYSSKRAGNDINSFDVAGYSLFDIGARYATNVGGKGVTWRLAVNNLADKHYWSTIAPSNITGTNTGNLVAHLGSPRTVSASMTIDF